MSAWIDISIPLYTGTIHWPGDPEPILERLLDTDQGEEANVTFLKMTAHTGTHLDAPCHFLAEGATLDAFPLETGIGPARVIEIPGDALRIGPEQLSRHAIEPGDRLLLKTRNSRTPWYRDEFHPDFASLSSEGARYLANLGIRLVGIDYLSIGAWESDGAETHRILLGAGIWILESLNLETVRPARYDLICLPLRIRGSDGAPVRAVIRPYPVPQ
jgi:arylformamidase